MNLWLRLFWMLATAPSRGRIETADGLSRITMRCWPNDLDLNVHMNNGRYLSCADIGRLDLLVRSGLLRQVRKHGWRPIMSGASVRFFRELKLFQRFAIESRVIYWSGRTLVMEHAFYETGGEKRLLARVLVVAAFYIFSERRFVDSGEVMKACGVTEDSPPASPEVETLIASFEALKPKLAA